MMISDSAKKIVRASVLIGSIAVSLSGACHGQVVKSFLVYDGQKYAPNQLEQAASSPVLRAMQKPLSGQNFALAKAVDGHFYVNGEVNGYPMTFMVDTGASVTCIPLWMARNAGIRAGVSGSTRTAGGLVSVGTSTNNVVKFGGFTLESATVCVLDKLEYPLLGAELLNRLRTSYRDGWMVISP